MKFGSGSKILFKKLASIFKGITCTFINKIIAHELSGVEKLHRLETSEGAVGVRHI